MVSRGSRTIPLPLAVPVPILVSATRLTATTRLARLVLVPALVVAAAAAALVTLLRAPVAGLVALGAVAPPTSSSTLPSLVTRPLLLNIRSRTTKCFYSNNSSRVYI